VKKLKVDCKSYLQLIGWIMFLFPLKLLAQGNHGTWGTHPGMFMGWGMGISGMLFMFIFWGLVILGVVFLVKWIFGSVQKNIDIPPTNSKALEILQERYARGEIDKDEFEARKQDLVI